MIGSANALRSKGLTQGSMEAQLDKVIIVKSTQKILICVTCCFRCFGPLVAINWSLVVGSSYQKNIDSPALSSKLCVVFLSPVISVSKM